MTTTTTHRPVTTLRAGDIVRTNGLRVRIDADAAPVAGHHIAGVFATRGTILNPDFLQTDQGRYLFGGIIPLDGSEPWTLQGTEFVTVAVESAPCLELDNCPDAETGMPCNSCWDA